MGIKKRDDLLLRCTYVGGESDGYVQMMRVGNVTKVYRAVSQYSKYQEYRKRIEIDGDDVRVLFEFTGKST